MKNILAENLIAHQALFNIVVNDAQFQTQIVSVAETLVQTLKKGGKVLLCGNGGSAADAEHISAEFVGSFGEYTKGLSAISLTANSAVITSLANDFGYECVFEKQIETLANEKDIVIGLTTSGKSENVLRALKAAKCIGAGTIALCGAYTAQIEADTVIAVPSEDTARIQEIHLFIGHCLAQYVKEHFSKEEING
ncbi:MAG: SIS domain-containing protein [Clostridia bacterium]|nr:SIS domain-containing protein [Clostridia bacterium]